MNIVCWIFLFLITFFIVSSIIEMRKRKLMLDYIVACYDIRCAILLYLIELVVIIMLVISTSGIIEQDKTLNTNGMLFLLVILTIFTYYCSKFKVLIDGEYIIIKKIFKTTKIHIKDITKIKRNWLGFNFYKNSKKIINIEYKFHNVNDKNIQYINELSGCNIDLR